MEEVPFTLESTMLVQESQCFSPLHLFLHGCFTLNNAQPITLKLIIGLLD